MMLEFYKMTGSEHDFVMVDNRDLELSGVLTAGNIKDICNRRFGIGADGFIVVEPSGTKGSSLIRCFNADGTEVELNHDAALCTTAFVDFLLDGAAKNLRFETKAGALKGKVNEDDSVTVQKGDKAFSGQALIVFRGEAIICED